MNSSKVNTQNTARTASLQLVSGQKTISAIIAFALAMITLFQAAAANSSEAATFVSAEEAALVAEFDTYFAEEAMDVELEEMIVLEEMEISESVKVYNQHNELIGEGNPDSNPLLNKLVNQADYLSEMGGEKYFKITE